MKSHRLSGAGSSPSFRYRLHDTSGRLLGDLSSDFVLRPGMIVDDRTGSSPREVAGVIGVAATVRPVNGRPVQERINTKEAR